MAIFLDCFVVTLLAKTVGTLVAICKLYAIISEGNMGGKDLISEIGKTPIKVKLLEAFKILNAHDIPIPKKGDPRITRRIKDKLTVTLMYREVLDVPEIYSTIIIDRARGYSKAGRYCAIGFDSPSSTREKFSDKGDVSLGPIPDDAKFMRWNLDDEAFELAKYST